jgi:hypothetical protein
MQWGRCSRNSRCSSRGSSTPSRLLVASAAAAAAAARPDYEVVTERGVQFTPGVCVCVCVAVYAVTLQHCMFYVERDTHFKIAQPQW